MQDKRKGVIHQLPFSLLHRKSRRYIYVRFRLNGGAWSSAISTGCETDSKAFETAFRWAREGIPSVRRKAKISVDIMSAMSSVSTADEAQWICDELSRKGFLRAYALSHSEEGRPISDFLLEFWDYDKSPYIKERQRKERGIHKTYCTQMTRLVRKWWLPHFKDKVLGCVTHEDIDSCADTMRKEGLIPSSCNITLSAVTIPLRWAYKKGIIKEDPTLGITRFASKSKERHILTPDVVTKLFNVEWAHDAYRLANLVASLTGMRCGEVQALRLCDILDGALQVSRSWSNIDGFKCPKNGKSRIVELPFPSVLEALRTRASNNPYNNTPQALVFWSENTPNAPISETVLLDALRCALIKTSMSKDDARQYVFHSWRHFFATYMRGRIDDKLLMTQTGHSTGAMLAHYSAHEAVGDRELIRQAERQAFEALLPSIG